MRRGTLSKKDQKQAKLIMEDDQGHPSTVIIESLPAEVRQALLDKKNNNKIDVLTDGKEFRVAPRERPQPRPVQPRRDQQQEQPAQRVLRVIGKDAGGNLRFERGVPKGIPQGTDPFLSALPGTKYTEDKPYLKITSFPPSDDIPEIRGAAPDIDRNPYNFVGFAGPEPWEDAPNDKHVGHNRWVDDLYSGVIEFQLTAKTPIFVPEGFPCKTDAHTREADRTITRRFCRMKCADGKERYAIPGSSFKGLLRSEVEALSNSRMGEVNKCDYAKAIPYRRRVFNTGVIRVTPSGEYEIEKTDTFWFRSPTIPHAFQYDNVFQRKIQPNGGRAGQFSDRVLSTDIKKERANYKIHLFADTTAKPHTCRAVLLRPTGVRLPIDAGIVKRYQDNIDHEHYKRHHGKYSPATANHYTSLPALNMACQHLKTLTEGELVFFTEENHAVNTFGKNANYLWPAGHSVRDLACKYYPREENSLRNPLGIAERLFGFAAPHKRDDHGVDVSHPFRGKLRIETLWGEPVNNNDPNKVERLELAPLTAPATRAKARPLYLVGDNKGVSKSYDDSDAQLKGRKFYWHQKTNTNSIASFHHKQPDHDVVKSQLPPPIQALKPGAVFTGRIHFDNLAAEELGCILTVLEGETANPNHGFKIGKGKPRGLGSVSCVIKYVQRLHASSRYESLLDSPGAEGLDPTGLKKQFSTWCAGYGRTDPNYTDPNYKNYKDDWTKLHQMPLGQSVRYYPVNFCDYGWLPADNDALGNPRNRRRWAMKAARDLGVE